MRNYKCLKKSSKIITKYRVQFFLSFFLLLYTGNLQAQPPRYNVIFINVDDLSIALGTYGNSFAPTPNIQRLADRGVLFRNVYTQYSLCNPSRASAFSGTRPQTTMIMDNVDSIRTGLGAGFRFLPEYFNDYGYRTECYGKFTCGHDREIYWDYFFGIRDNDDFSSSTNEQDEYGTKGSIAAKTASTQEPKWYIDTANQTIETTADGRETTKLLNALQNPVATPFFYNLGLETHNSFTPLLENWNKTGDPSISALLPVDEGFVYTDVYGNGSANIPLPEYPPDDTDDIPDVALKAPFIYTPEAVQQLRHAYYSEIIQVDANVGRVLDKIDQLDLWKNSVVVFWSDHGLNMGEHNGIWLKTNLFEEALRIPMIICAPGIQPAVCNRLVEAVDLFQTLTELCNLPEMPDREGSSMVPLLQNPNFRWKNAIFANQLRLLQDSLLATAVRTDRWHYNSWEDQGEELYDMINDPREITNLVSNPAYTDTLQYMRDLLAIGWQGVKPPVYNLKSFFKDQDGDGFGVSDDSLVAYAKPQGYVLKQGDCNDNDTSINPAKPELPCNNKDDNCSNGTDENRPVPYIQATGSLDLCISGEVRFTTNPGSGLSYQWLRNGARIPGARSRNYVATTVGTYKVLVSTPTCSNISEEKVVFMSNCQLQSASEISSLKLRSLSSITVSPNPSTGIFVLQHVSEANATQRVFIYNAAGQVVFTQNISVKAGNNAHQLNLSMLEAGAYELAMGNLGRIKIIKM